MAGASVRVAADIAGGGAGDGDEAAFGVDVVVLHKEGVAAVQVDAAFVCGVGGQGVAGDADALDAVGGDGDFFGGADGVVGDFYVRFPLLFDVDAVVAAMDGVGVDGDVFERFIGQGERVGEEHFDAGVSGCDLVVLDEQSARPARLHALQGDAVQVRDDGVADDLVVVAALGADAFCADLAFFHVPVLGAGVDFVVADDVVVGGVDDEAVFALEPDLAQFDGAHEARFVGQGLLDLDNRVAVGCVAVGAFVKVNGRAVGGVEMVALHEHVVGGRADDFDGGVVAFPEGVADDLVPVVVPLHGRLFRFDAVVGRGDADVERACFREGVAAHDVAGARVGVVPGAELERGAGRLRGVRKARVVPVADEVGEGVAFHHGAVGVKQRQDADRPVRLFRGEVQVAQGEVLYVVAVEEADRPGAAAASHFDHRPIRRVPCIHRVGQRREQPVLIDSQPFAWVVDVIGARREVQGAAARRFQGVDGIADRESVIGGV